MHSNHHAQYITDNIGYATTAEGHIKNCTKKLAHQNWADAETFLPRLISVLIHR